MLKSFKIKKLFLFVFICGSMSLAAQEQQDISDKELVQFADAYTEVQVLNQQSQQKMMSILQEEGLEIERFNEIQQAKMDPNKKSDATDVEKKKHENITTKIEKMQPELEKNAIASIESTGISIKKFEALAAKIQEDTSLQQRLQTIMEKRQEKEY